MCHWQIETTPLIQRCVLPVCHLYLFCFIQSYFKNTNTVLKLRIKMNYFYYLSDFALSLLYFWVVFQCWVYSLVNLFAEILSSKYDCSENVTTKSCHFWVGSIELLVGVGLFFSSRTLWEIFLFIVFICFIFSKNFFFHFWFGLRRVNSMAISLLTFCSPNYLKLTLLYQGFSPLLALLSAVCWKQV